MTKPMQSVLVVDDDRQNRDLLAGLLKDDCRVLLARNGAQALERARVHQPDLILLDIVMPEMDGYQVIQTLQADSQTRAIPVILISALDSLADEERGLDLGAVDYISKPFHPSIVRKRVCNHLQAVRHRRLLENMALVDALTEIPNRRRYDQVLDHEWRRALRSGELLSLAIIDVDHFKPFNDRYGHAAGDLVLRSVAACLEAHARRPGDLVARYGGEEFVVILPGIAAVAAREHLEVMRRAVEQLCLPTAACPGGHRVTVSVGGCTLHPLPERDPASLFMLADEALYQAKTAGRNRLQWHDMQKPSLLTDQAG